MAEGALLELSGNVLKLLSSLILEEVKLAISVKTETERLAETVSLIQPLIRELEKQSSHSHQNEDWLRKLKVVLDDAKKLLDDFSTEVDSELCNICCSSNLFTYGVKTARGIKAIRKRLKDIAEEAESSQSSVEDIAEEAESSQSSVEPEARAYDVWSALKFSYDFLPAYLQQCFAFCGSFPKDYKIDVTTLINLWAANGFIQLSNPEQRLEDVGRVYFMELLKACFFEVVQEDEYGNISYCKMHDVLHDLAILVRTC